MIEKSLATFNTSHLFSENRYEIKKIQSLVRNIRNILSTNVF